MFVLFIVILLVLVFQGFILLEEETLIVLASFVWIDAAGQLIRENIYNALEEKGDSIKSDYLFFLELKEGSLLRLKELHTVRAEYLEKLLVSWKLFFVSATLSRLASCFYKGVVPSQAHENKVFIESLGYPFINEVLVEELKHIFRSVPPKL